MITSNISVDENKKKKKSVKNLKGKKIERTKTDIQDENSEIDESGFFDDFTEKFENRERFLKEMDRDDDKKLDEWRRKIKDKTKDRSTVEGVLDSTTSKIVFKLINMGFFKSLGGIISTGKEANVYYAQSDKKELTNNIDNLAIKIYRTRTLDFKKIKSYIAGDRRFQNRAGRKSHQIIEQWALKEYKNLTRAFEAGVSVPQPFFVKRNVLIMEYIKEDVDKHSDYYTAAPTLQEIQNDEIFLASAKSLYKKIIEEVKMLWNKAELVHGDLSEFNILGIRPYLANETFKCHLIDISQAVLNTHLSAHQFLLRDLFNINNFFSRIEAKDEIDILELKDLYKEIVGNLPIEKDMLQFETTM
ncbi:MAG: serine protein kinase RIO [Candidatus Hodarchaeales archaeon]